MLPGFRRGADDERRPIGRRDHSMARRTLPVMRKSTRVALIVTGVVAGLAASGTGIGYVVADTAKPAAPDPAAIECANIERAYNAWAAGRLRDMYEYNLATAPDLLAEVEDQRELLEAVSGYDSQASRDLATAVARFGAELAVLRAQMTISGGTDLDQAAAVADAQTGLRQQYAAWRAATCG